MGPGERAASRNPLECGTVQSNGRSRRPRHIDVMMIPVDKVSGTRRGGRRFRLARGYESPSTPASGVAPRSGMSIVSVDVEVSGESGTQATTTFLVDSGASYSVLPRAVWKRLGLRPKRAMCFELADGTAIRRQLSECRFTFAGIDAVSPVVLGQQKDVALLGTVTLETMGLVLHPFERQLRPMRLLLAAVR
jgi:clan AA aspartic protease